MGKSCTNILTTTKRLLAARDQLGLLSARNLDLAEEATALRDAAIQRALADAARADVGAGRPSSLPPAPPPQPPTARRAPPLPRAGGRAAGARGSCRDSTGPAELGRSRSSTGPA